MKINNSFLCKLIVITTISILPFVQIDKHFTGPGDIEIHYRQEILSISGQNKTNLHENYLTYVSFKMASMSSFKRPQIKTTFSEIILAGKDAH